MSLADEIPIIDSHIHLFAQSHLPNLTWAGDLPPDHVLNRGNTVSVYKDATSGIKNLRGFVFLETDRKSGLNDDQWQHPLEEAAFLARIAQGTPEPDEGHVPSDSKLLLGVVPWAPVPAGPDALARYVANVMQLYPIEHRSKVKGFRYLLQDKAAKVMLQNEFIAGLRWLGEQGLSFDLGVDARSTGLFQLEEACLMMEKLYGAGGKTTIIINHFCKPNLQLSEDEVEDHQDFVQWKAYIEKMASFQETYMKLSGFFSELPEQTEDKPTDIHTLIGRILPWAKVVFSAFTPERIMFGSDWPVCNVNGPGPAKSYTHWHKLVTVLLSRLQLSHDDLVQVWHGTAARAYRITY